ncbi:MAG: hypothetical protein WC821_04770 [archaeon]|jgi:hypothetical protein
MGIFDFLKQKKSESQTEADKILEGTESSEVLVPDHAKPDFDKSKTEEVFLVQKKDKKSIFRVTGVYDIGSEIMVSGFVEAGKLKKKMKTKINDHDAVISDIKVGSESVLELLIKEEGKVFLRGRNLYTLKTDDVLEFK